MIVGQPPGVSVLSLLVACLLVGCATVPSAPAQTTAPAATASMASSGLTATPSPVETPERTPAHEVRTSEDVPITALVPCYARECEVPADVISPVSGGRFPTIVLLPGGPTVFGERRYVQGLAVALAERGAVVFLATYRSPITQNTEEESLLDVRCAIRFARANAATYGGDPERVTLVGHSLGGELAIEAAVRPDAESPGCLAEGSGIPDAVVALAPSGVPVREIGEARPPLMLVTGSLDPANFSGRSLTDRLEDEGFDATFVELDGIDHEAIIEPDLSPSVVDLIFDAARAADE